MLSESRITRITRIARICEFDSPSVPSKIGIQCLKRNLICIVSIIRVIRVIRDSVCQKLYTHT